MPKLTLAVALVCPLLATAPALAASVRPDAIALLAQRDRAEVAVERARPGGRRSDRDPRTIRLVPPSAVAPEAWPQIYAAPRGDFVGRFARDPGKEMDFVFVASGDDEDASDWESPTGGDAVPAVPEPAAGIAFSLGSLIVGAFLLRVRRRAEAARSSGV